MWVPADKYYPIEGEITSLSNVPLKYGGRYCRIHGYQGMDPWIEYLDTWGREKAKLSNLYWLDESKKERKVHVPYKFTEGLQIWVNIPKEGIQLECIQTDDYGVIETGRFRKIGDSKIEKSTHIVMDPIQWLLSTKGDYQFHRKKYEQQKWSTNDMIDYSKYVHSVRMTNGIVLPHLLKNKAVKMRATWNKCINMIKELNDLV